MGRNRRVAYAVADERALLLGQPATRGLQLTPEHLVRRKLGYPDGAESPVLVEPWRASWTQVTSLTVDAPVSGRRRPGLLPMLGAVAVEAIGAGGAHEGAELTVTLQLADAPVPERQVVCDGYVGKGYWRGDLTALAALLELLVDRPATRTALEEPFGLLDLVAKVGREDPAYDDALERLGGALA